MAAEGSTLHDDLHAAFLRHREGRYDPVLDRRLKAAGLKILEENDPRKSSRINPHSIFWMVAAITVFYYTDFYLAVRFDSRIYRNWLYIGCTLIGLNLCIGCYCVIWLSYVKKISNWEKHSPYVIPIGTASFIAGMICSTYALWPVWKVFTPFITFTLFMGVVFLSTLLPV